MLGKYKEYLEKLNKRLDEYFDNQREYIACKAGCSNCCCGSYYAVSDVEFQLVREGFQKLPAELQESIRQKSVEIFKARREFLKTNPDVMKFKYECPFLLNESCGIYEYRGLLCRSHGLIYKDVEKENKHNVPYCVNLGLNYSQIWDSERKCLSEEKIEQLGLKTMPEAYDLSYSCMMRDAGDIQFGDVRMIFEWVILDIPDYEKLISV